MQTRCVLVILEFEIVGKSARGLVMKTMLEIERAREGGTSAGIERKSKS
jgi:hypothetical protein